MSTFLVAGDFTAASTWLVTNSAQRLLVGVYTCTLEGVGGYKRWPGELSARRGEDSNGGGPLFLRCRLIWAPPTSAEQLMQRQWLPSPFLLLFLLSVGKVTGCRPRPPPPIIYAKEGRQKSFERGNYPPPPHWDRRAIQPNHIKFRTCSALAPMWTPPINKNAEQTRGPLINSVLWAVRHMFVCTRGYKEMSSIFADQ